MNLQTTFRFAGLGLALLFSSCPGDSDVSASDDVNTAIEASSEQTEEAYNASVNEMSKEIQAASEEASNAIDEKNAESELDDLMKQLNQDQ